jgi:type II secretory pathway component PulF
MAAAQWCSLMQVLVKYRVSLPEALRWCESGAASASFRELSRDLAQAVNQGHSLSEALSGDRRVPASLVPLVRWGERAGALAEAFSTAQDMFARRILLRIVVLQSIVPPVLFIALGCCVLLIAGGLFMPLWSLLRGLT